VRGTSVALIGNVAMTLLLVIGVGLTFAVLAARLPEPPMRKRASSANGVPIVIIDEPRRRIARGSTAPPASLDLARVRFGELQTRRLGTPMPSCDDGWELVRSLDDDHD